MAKRKDGRIERKFTVNGKRYTVYGRTMAECREKEMSLRQRLAEGIYKPGRELTIEEYFDRWVEAKRGSVKECTIRANKILFKAMSGIIIDGAGNTFGCMKIPDIEPQNIRDIQINLLPERTTRTVNDSVYMLKSIFRSAINDRIITWNPAAGVKSLKRTEPKARDTIHRALSVEETRQFLEAAQGSWYLNLYVFLLHTGCRIGEAGALLAGDISAQGVKIDKTITRMENGGYMVGNGTKTAAGNRVVPIDKGAAAAIAAQRIQNMVYSLDADKQIFQRPSGSLIKSSSVNRDIASICEKAGIDRFTVHAFRDTFATRCVESGMQPKILQDIMGHSDIKMTMNLYAHSMDETREQQLKAVNFG